MTSLIEESGCAVCLGLFELDKPFASILLPICSNDFGAEVHVFPEAPDFADLVQILPDIW